MTPTQQRELRLAEHVERLEQDHPPIDLGGVDYTVRRPRDRFGAVLSYMARVELEVERNVLELGTLLPHPPEIDRHFYADVWYPQEVRHGVILDRLQSHLGRPPAAADLTSVSTKIRVLGTVAHLEAVQDVCRMLYYLTGMATERSAVLAYNFLADGLVEIGEVTIAQTVVAPIRRQEPGHYAFYRMSAGLLWERLAPWQRWLVRRMRERAFAPVGANDRSQLADFGEVMGALGIDRDVDTFAAQVVRTERELLWAQRSGLEVPAYVSRAFREAIELARMRSAATEPSGVLQASGADTMLRDAS
jgi:hypothetical protein